MRSSLLFVTVLIAFTGSIFSASTGDSESIVELEAKVATLLESNEIHKRKEKDLEEALAGVQLRLQATSEEYGALKSQFISFFQKASTSKKDSSSLTHRGDNTTATAGLFSAGSHSDGTDEGDKLQPVTLQMTATGGVSYIRWGRITCPGDATEMYNGFAAGKKKHSTGAAVTSDFLCLPYKKNLEQYGPEWENQVAAFKDLAAIQGVEYEMGADDPFSTEKTWGQPLLDNDMPCALCHIETRSHQIMIPARKSCPTGWTLEYWGFLVTTSKTLSGGPFICLDQAPEVTTGGSANLNPQTVYTVEASCVGLHCPPYVQGFELTCAVCSK